MFITGFDARRKNNMVCGSRASGCGKTTTAMAGNHFVGDDLAQMWIDKDGAIRAVNPECGFRNCRRCEQRRRPASDDIAQKPGHGSDLVDVLIDDKGVPHWTGNGEEHPKSGRNFQGKWEQGMKDSKGKLIPISHPNARCTLSSKPLAIYSAKTKRPKVWKCGFSHTAAETAIPCRRYGLPKLRNTEWCWAHVSCQRQPPRKWDQPASNARPWANTQFIPGSLVDYLDAQFEFLPIPRLAKDKQPLLAGLNYFLTDKARGGTSEKLLGEKRDVKAWMGWLERRSFQEVEAIETPIGFIPKYQDLKTPVR